LRAAIFSIVASRLKIFQNNSKPAEKRKCFAGKTGGHTAAVLDTSGLKFCIFKAIFSLSFPKLIV
jgi:hypothetical protein